MLAETFPPRPGFLLEDYLRCTETRSPGVAIRVKFSTRSANRARREWALGMVHDETVADGVVLTLTAGQLDWFITWLLSFGTWATVLEPAELREKLVVAAEAAANHHRGNPGKGS